MPDQYYWYSEIQRGKNRRHYVVVMPSGEVRWMGEPRVDIIPTAPDLLELPGVYGAIDLNREDYFEYTWASSSLPILDNYPDATSHSRNSDGVFILTAPDGYKNEYTVGDHGLNNMHITEAEILRLKALCKLHKKDMPVINGR